MIRSTGSSGHIKIRESHLLNKEGAKALQAWLAKRNRMRADSSALWIGQQGQQLSIAGIAFVIRRIGWQAHLVLSPEVLRQTCIANLIKEKDKAELAVEFGKYMSLSTVRRFGISGNKEYRTALQQLHSRV